MGQTHCPFFMSSIFKLGGLLVLCLAIGVLTVFLLQNFTAHRQMGGGFRRNFRNDFLHLRKVTDLQYNSYYIAQITGGRLYLGNVSLPTHMLSASLSSLDTNFIKLSLPADAQFDLTALQIALDSPRIYAFETATPAFMEGSMTNWKVRNIPFSKIPFLGFPRVTSPCSFVVTT